VACARHATCPHPARLRPEAARSCSAHPGCVPFYHTPTPGRIAPLLWCPDNGRILLANPTVLKIVPRICRRWRYRNLENPTQQSRLYRVEIGSPTVTHEPGLSTATHENSFSVPCHQAEVETHSKGLGVSSLFTWCRAPGEEGFSTETLRKAIPVTYLFLFYMEPLSTTMSRGKIGKADSGKRDYRYL
jgi:hypothetical protein